MNLKQLLLSLTLALLCSPVASAQTTGEQPPLDQEQAQKLIEQKKDVERKTLVLLDEIIAGIPSLRLPENRALLQSSAADLLWPHDEKRARALFKEALTNLAEMTGKIDSKQSPGGDVEVSIQRQRQTILQLIARHDPRMALEVMRATRPTVVSTDQVLKERQRGNELELEQSLALQVAASDPKAALQMAKDGLAKGFSIELLNVVKRLQAVDSEAATQLAEEIIARLVADKFESRGGTEFIAVALLQMTLPRQGEAEFLAVGQLPLPSSPLKLSEQSLRNLVDLITNVSLATMDNRSQGRIMLSFLPSIMPAIEQAAPERAALLQRRLAETENGPEGPSLMYARLNMMMRNGTIDEMLDLVAKTPDTGNRDMLYEQIVWKALSENDENRARQIVNEKLSNSSRRKTLLEQIESQSVWSAVMKGKVDEARQKLSRLKSKDERALALSYLAVNLALKGDKKTALQLLDEARSMTALKPRNALQLNAMMQIIRGYAITDPPRGFDLIETLVEQANDLIAAAATLDGFIGSTRKFQKGELMMTGGYNSVVERYQHLGKQLAQLALINFDRTKAAADRFQRLDMRLLARLLIVQAVLSEQLGSGISPNERTYYGSIY